MQPRQPMQKTSWAERKLAMRMQLAAMRGSTVWSDGKKVLRGEELVKARRQLVHRLARGPESAVPAGQYRVSNSMQMLRMYLKNPRIHDLPAGLGAILRDRCREFSGAVSYNAPGTANHLTQFRRMAIRIGAIRPGEFAPERERHFLQRRLYDAPAIRACHDDVTAEVRQEGGSFEAELLGKGERLTRLEGENSLWTKDDGTIVSVARLEPEDFTSARPSRSMNVQMSRSEDLDAGPSF